MIEARAGDMVTVKGYDSLRRLHNGGATRVERVSGEWIHVIGPAEVHVINVTGIVECGSGNHVWDLSFRHCTRCGKKEEAKPEPEKPLPCPFCGLAVPFVQDRDTRYIDNSWMEHPKSESCRLTGFKMYVPYWNKRPLEDALKLRLKSVESGNGAGR